MTVHLPMEYHALFPDLPDDAQLWVYIADRPLTDDEQRALERRLERFADSWTYHDHAVRGAVEVVDRRILLLAATTDHGSAISGCGIDASTNAVEEAAQAIGFRWASPLDVFFRDDEGNVQQCARGAFQERIEQDGLTTETHVLDPSITTVEELRAGRFEQPARATWHARVFDWPQPA